jgi:protoporphyrinogen/coproporphyrinogen III oxidase
MLGQIDPSKSEVTVIGAGIGGLLIAYELTKRGYEVTLIEASSRSGGLIRTTEHRLGIVESAAQSFLVTPAVRDLCAELGVELLPVKKEARARFILRSGKLRRFPLTLGEVLGAFVRAYFLLAPRKIRAADMTMEQWGLRFLGGAATRYLLAPFITGIYGVRPADLRVRAAFPALAVPPGHSLVSFLFVHRNLLRLRSRISGIFQGRRVERTGLGMQAPRYGMGSIVVRLDALLSERLGSRFRHNERIESLDRLLEGERNVVLAVPAAEAARLLATVDPALGEALSEVQYTPLVSITAFVARSDLKREPRGVGVLIPELEGHKALGVLFNSSAFEERVRDSERWASYTLMFGGALHPEMADSLNWNDYRMECAVRMELEVLFGLKPAAPLEMVIHRWPRAIPKYDVRVEKAWEMARRGWCSQPGRVIFGNYSGQVSLRGMVEAVGAVAPCLHSSDAR